MSARLDQKTQTVRAVRAPPHGPERAGIWSRQIAAVLGAVLLENLGLAAAVEWYVHQFQKYTGVRYALTVSETEGFETPEEYATGIFEILHDALNHVARCAQTSRVSIALTITPREVGMIMQHDGVGASGALVQIRQRARAYRGWCEVSGEPEAGTTVSVNLPLPTAPSA